MPDAGMSDELPSPPPLGWETCLESEPLDGFRCRVCTGLMLDPVTSGCEEQHVLCRPCIEMHLSSNGGGKCPAGCGGKISKESIAPMPEIRRMIHGLRSRCKHAAPEDDDVEACRWTGDLGNLLVHLRDRCLYETVACPFAEVGCCATMQRRELKAHVDSEVALHLRLACGKLGSLGSTVAQMRSDIESLQAERALARLQLSASVPQLIELRFTARDGEPALEPQVVHGWLGLYSLDDAASAGGKAVWVNATDGSKCISHHEGRASWMVQPRYELGSERSWLRKKCDCASPSCAKPSCAWVDTMERPCPGVSCVAWVESAGSVRTIAPRVELGGRLPSDLDEVVPHVYDFFGEYIHTGVGRYEKRGDPTKMMWFARWLDDDEFTGWYVGQAGEAGKASGYLLAKTSYAAFDSAGGATMLSSWMVAGPGHVWKPAPDVTATTIAKPS